MQPYVIRQGDYLEGLACRFAFDADAVWNDPANGDLRKLRPNRNILWPTDVLYIPDTTDAKQHSLAVGQVNDFVASDPPTITLTHTFEGDDASNYASKAFTVQELPSLTGLTTDGKGTATFPVPVTLDTATIVFTETGESWALAIGELDPIDTPSGIFHRLQSLGYLGRARLDGNDLEILRDGLRALKADQPGAAPAEGTDPPSDVADDAGLSDEGVLSAPMTDMLRQAYGC